MAGRSVGYLERHYGVKARSRILRDILIAAAMLRERGVRPVLRHGRGVALLRLHAALVDRRVYAGLPQAFNRNEAVVQEYDLKVSNPVEIEDAHPCSTIPSKTLDWALDGAQVDPRAHSFVDIGSGAAAALLHAARRPFIRAVGVELAREVHEIALENLDWAKRNWPLQAGEVELRNESAIETELPDTPCVLFLFNPFRERVMSEFVTHLLRSHRDNPRPITVLYAHPLHADLFEREPFVRVPLRRRQALLLRALSPHQVNAYRLE